MKQVNDKETRKLIAEKALKDCIRTKKMAIKFVKELASKKSSLGADAFAAGLVLGSLLVSIERIEEMPTAVKSAKKLRAQLNEFFVDHFGIKLNEHLK